MTATSAKRDHRIDFWRGLALVTIFVNHVPGNLLEHVTHRNYGLSDSAELFVFLAGFSAAIAYFGRFLAGDPVIAVGRVVARTWSLYCAHIVLIVAAIGIFFVAAMAFHDVHWAEAYGLDVLSTDPIRGFVGLVSLGHQIGYFNILPLYVALFAMLPVIMLLAARSLGLALAASLTLYLWSHIDGIRLPSYPSEGGWFFEPLRWQLLFTIGFVAGELYRRGRPVPFRPWAYAAAVAVVAAGAVVAIFGLHPQPGALPLPGFLWLDDKTGLSLPRLVHVLALVYLVAHAPYAAADRLVARIGPDGVLASIGRHGLALFCLGSVLAVIGQVALRASGGGVATGTTIVLAGIVLHVAAVRGLAWWKARTAAAAGRAPARVAGAPAIV
jgi:hypothetical protein